jgi:hypothetical protein
LTESERYLAKGFAAAIRALKGKPAAPAASGDLHNAIMNLPNNPAKELYYGNAETRAYKEGHKVARHAAAELVAGFPAAPLTVPQGWVSVDERLPDIPANTSRQFIIACKRAHNDQTYVFAADYLNGLLLQSDDDDCPEEGMPVTGWYIERNDSDYDTAWHHVCTTTGDEVTHWHELPAAPAVPGSGMAKGEGHE